MNVIPKEPITINIEKVIASKSESVAKYTPKFIINWLKKLIHQDELNEMLRKHPGETGFDFAQSALDELNVKGDIKYINKSSLKTDGRYIFVSNHPLGGLDGLILIKEIGKNFNNNIKFVVNDFLMHIKPLEPLFVPVNKVGSMKKENVSLFEQAYSSDSQILYFPAGLCSRLINGEITDTEWKTSFIKQAIKYNRQVVPVYFSGENSKRFYRIAKLRKFLKIKFNIEMCLLPDEMFRKKNTTFEVTIGEPLTIPQLKNNKEMEQMCQHIREVAHSLKHRNQTYNYTPNAKSNSTCR